MALLLVSTPVLVAAHTSRVAFEVQLRWLPVAGLGSPSYVLPVLSLGALSTGYPVLLVRSELLLSLRAPHVKAAAARGIAS